MQFTKQELYELTEPTGGRFSVGKVEEAYAFCRRLALGHYENFPVASALLPRGKRDYVFSVYAFARIADDIADELTADPSEERKAALERMDSLIDSVILRENEKGNPVFIALHETMAQLNIPAEPFHKLLIAFTRDIFFRQPADYNDLLDYCSYSANPVGELVLRIFEIYNNKTASLSDKICTGLQLVNFWQDISVDMTKNRIYLPSEVLDKYNVKESDLQERKFSANLNDCLIELFEFTEKLLDEGLGLIKYLKPKLLRAEISATAAGGKLMLKKVKKLGPELLLTRPVIKKSEMLNIILIAFLSNLWN